MIVAIAVVFVVMWMVVETRFFCSNGEAERAIAVTAEVTEVAYCSDGNSSSGMNNIEGLEVVGSLQIFSIRCQLRRWHRAENAVLWPNW